MEFSYSYQNKVRDLSNIFKVLRANAPVLLSLVGETENKVRQVKHEWNEYRLRAQIAKANGAVAEDGAALVVDDATFAAALPVGSHIIADGNFEILVVSGPAVGPSIPISRGYGGAPAEPIADGQLIRFVAMPKAEGSLPGDDPGTVPVPEWNQTQIFDRTAKVTETTRGIDIYGVDDSLDFQVNYHMDQIVREVNTALIYGRRVERTSNANGSAGGLLHFLSQNNSLKVNAAGGALGETMLNGRLEKIVVNGGRPATILCNTNQARRITAFNKQFQNYTILREDKVAGSVVYTFQGDLPMEGMVQNIVVDPNFSSTMLAILDMSRIHTATLRAFKDKDATPPGADFAARRVLGELTFEIENALEAHALLHNLQA